MNGVNTFRHMVNSEDKSDVNPSSLKMKFMKKILNRMKITEADIQRISKMMTYEYNFWKDRGWLKAGSFKQLLNMPIPENFNLKERLLVKALTVKKTALKKKQTIKTMMKIPYKYISLDKDASVLL